VIVSVSLLAAVTLVIPLVVTGAIDSEVHHSHRAARSVWRAIKVPITSTHPRAFITVMEEHRELVVDPTIVTSLDRVHAQFPGDQAVQQNLARLFLGCGAFTLWWAILGLVRSLFPRLVREVLFPLCQQVVERRISRIGVVCLALFAIWCAFAYQIATNAGLL